MKKNFYLCILLLIPFSGIRAQFPDYHWALGGANVFRFFLDFSTDPPSQMIRTDSITTIFISTYTDSYGKIKYFSNGLDIYNREGMLLENGNFLIIAFLAGKTVCAFLFLKPDFFCKNPAVLIYCIY